MTTPAKWREYLVSKGRVLLLNSQVLVHHLLGILLRTQAVLLVLFRLKEKEEARFGELAPILKLERRLHVKLELHWQAIELHCLRIQVELDAHVQRLVTLVLQNEHRVTLLFNGLVVGDFASFRRLLSL